LAKKNNLIDNELHNVINNRLSKLNNKTNFNDIKQLVLKEKTSIKGKKLLPVNENKYLNFLSVLYHSADFWYNENGLKYINNTSYKHKGGGS
jgi:hypothetical protein